MVYPTLLRYPGGKRRAIKTLEVFDVKDTIVSPFFGGGSFELSQLNKGKTVLANDLFYCLTNFWNTVNTLPEHLANIVEPLLGKVSKEVFKQFQECLRIVEQDYHYSKTVQEVLDNSRVQEVLTRFFGEVSSVSVAGCFYIVNRCSFSGATLSGGFSSSASQSRFTASGVNKIRAWIPTGKLIVMCKDFQSFLEPLIDNTDSTWFLDPPYLLQEPASNTLYGVNGSYHQDFNHEALQSLLDYFHSNGGSFILTYNNSPTICQMYKQYNIQEAQWSYGMNKTKKSSELIIINS